jgi:hypothetical protein
VARVSRVPCVRAVSKQQEEVGGALLDRTFDEEQRGQDRSAGQVQLAKFSRR